MSTLEIGGLDPLIRRGFHLLHSRSRDSADQLKALLEEAQRQRLGKSSVSCPKDPLYLRKESPIPRSQQSSPSNISLNKGNELKREHSHKVREDEVLLKKPRLDSPHSSLKSHTPSPTPSLKSDSSSRSRKSEESDSSDADMNDLAMEIGINCTVCKSFEQASGNQLVECQECHSLYHQECHKPAVTHQDVTDPRLVWYCAKCSRSIKKQGSLLASSGGSSLGGMRSSSVSSSGSSSKSGSSHSSTSTSSTSRPSPSKGIGLQRPSPFTNLSSVSGRTVGSSISGSSSNSNNGNGSSSRSTLSSSSSSSRNSAPPPAANSIMNAERRVHLMKKKAAKNAERRKII